MKVASEMTGTVWKICVSEGDSVAEEDTLIILESMKMEIPIESPEDGTVRQIRVKEGDVVQEGDIVALLEEA
ncbi:MAG: acetyl-CoA carboxylase biotin carboxyl carrier protein subunit [Candidatus Dadabacteria bacterium]|nr:MAG: acetyl-CoA carboxylase biotin carboxyl carrier protein subunit [Candidatus Dadabacteria bacterium]